MNKDTICIGYYRPEITKYIGNTKRYYFKDVDYVNAHEDDDHCIKIIVCPNMVIGNTVVNVIVESYQRSYVCTHSGIKARDGWHKAPSYAYRWDKKPYNTEVLSLESFEHIYGNIELSELD